MTSGYDQYLHLYIDDIIDGMAEFYVAVDFVTDTDFSSFDYYDLVEPDFEALGQELELEPLAGTRQKGIAHHLNMGNEGTTFGMRASVELSLFLSWNKWHLYLLPSSVTVIKSFPRPILATRTSFNFFILQTFLDSLADNHHIIEVGGHTTNHSFIVFSLEITHEDINQIYINQ